MTILSALLLLLCVFGMFALLRRQEATQRKDPGNPLMLEYRTDLPLDDCLDLLRQTTEKDIFVYTFTREADGNFALEFTQHRATEQPISTLYTLHLDSGRQTVLSLAFVREAFGYKEPVFPLSLLDDFFAEKLSAHRTL